MTDPFLPRTGGEVHGCLRASLSLLGESYRKSQTSKVSLGHKDLAVATQPALKADTQKEVASLFRPLPAGSPFEDQNGFCFMPGDRRGQVARQSWGQDMSWAGTGS